MIKKIMSFFLILSFIFNLSFINILAASPFSISSNQSTYSFDIRSDKDETFEVEFRTEGINDINSATFRVMYDPNVIVAVDNKNMETDGFVKFDFADELKSPFISPQLVNNQINAVPSSSDDDFEGKADRKKTAAQLGIVKIAAISATSWGKPIPLNEDGILFRMTFKVIGEGKTDISMSPSVGNKYMFFADNGNVNPNVSPVEVNVIGESTTTTTEKTTESTTEKTTEKTTESTTEKTTESTTEKSTSTTETTTIRNSDSNNSDDDETESTTELGTDNNTSNSINNKTSPQTKESSNSNGLSKDSISLIFNDLNNYTWAVEAIESLAAKNIINGVGDKRFNPSYNIKRADFLLMLVNVLELKGTAKSNFADVDSNRYYANAVGLAKDLGIVSGKGDNKFYPEENITRQDMMVIAEKALNSKVKVNNADKNVLNKFKDVNNISPYAKQSLANMVNIKVVNGTGENIEPKSYTTRAQAAVIVYNIYNIINS